MPIGGAKDTGKSSVKPFGSQHAFLLVLFEISFFVPSFNEN